MLILLLPCATDFIDRLNNGINSQGCALSSSQQRFLAFVLCAIVLAEKLCWATFQRRSLGQYTSGALWWMFYQSNIAWHLLLRISVVVIIETYGLTGGNLLLDDTGRNRPKRTTKIGKARKMKDKKSNGYVNGQELVIRGGKEQKVTVLCARLKIKSHGKKRFVIALKYEGEEAQQAIFEYIEVYYNRQRKHSTNGYLTPFKYEQQLAEAA